MRELTGYRQAVDQGRPETFYDELHKGPVHDPELGVVIVGTYSAARQVLDNRDGDFSNAHTLTPLYTPEPDVLTELRDIFHTHGGDHQGLAFLDGPAHRERRRRARSASSSVSVDEVTADLVDRCLTEFDKKVTHPADGGCLVEDFIKPLASRSSLQRTIGVPADLATELGPLLHGQVELLWGLPGPERQRQLVRDLHEVWRLCVESIRRNRESRSAGAREHNIITGYLGDNDDVAPQDRLDLYGYVNAGYISNVHSLSNLVVHALEAPERWKRLHADPGQIPGFVQETLAHRSGVHGWFKLVLPEADAGVEVGGAHVAAGTRVVVALNAANASPDRGADDPIVSFSHGPHTCLGKDFALRLMTAALRGLVDRYPGLRLVGTPQPWANLAFNGHPGVRVALS